MSFEFGSERRERWSKFEVIREREFQIRGPADQKPREASVVFETRFNKQVGRSGRVGA